jgi:hypothetical protein
MPGVTGSAYFNIRRRYRIVGERNRVEIAARNGSHLSVSDEALNSRPLKIQTAVE